MEFKKNPDGTDFLDENGNKVPVEITDEAKEAARVNAQLVEELKELRLKNGLMKDLLDKAATPPTPPTPPAQLTEEDKINLAVEKILSSKEASNAQANKKAAFEKFVKENKEFDPENDPTGLKRDALEKKFNRFNTDGLTTIDEFTSLIGEAKVLLVGHDIPTDTSRVPTPFSNVPTPKGSPQGKPDEILSPKELKLAETTGRSKEELIKLKLKHPDLVRDLLEFVRD